MAETPKHLVQHQMGCGFVGALFHSVGLKARRLSAPPLPPIKNPMSIIYSTSSNSKTKRRRSTSTAVSIIGSAVSTKPPPKQGKRPTTRKPPMASQRPSISSHNQIQSRRSSNSTRNSTPNNEYSQVTNLSYTKKLRKEPTFTEGEFSMKITDRKKPSENGTLYRANSGNTMIKQNIQKKEITGNIVKKNSGGSYQLGNIYRSSPMNNNLNPEVLKSTGNEKYKQGRFEEALALYNQAIGFDSSKASYYSNRSAALIGLGRLLEAVYDCRVAIRLDPSYHRAHQRLAKLYTRLGEADKALSHYKHSGAKSDSEDIAQAQSLKTYLIRCSKAQKVKDWNILLNGSKSAISSGADSAPQIYAMQAEALLKLHRHQEAYAVIQKGPNFDINMCTKFFGSAGSANLLKMRAQVYMAAGRFEEALGAAHHAAQLDSGDEIKAVLKRARALASARSNGNRLFKASKFSEACIVYTEGLENEPNNSILLCNRAACRSKLGQFEKAAEDCSAALNLQPSYAKARLRRADCNAKLERWEAAIKDYEVSIQETPADEEIGRALAEAQVQLKKRESQDIRNITFDSKLVLISSKEQFRHYVISPGTSVVLFCNRTCHEQVVHLMVQVCERFPSVSFLKVDTEDHPNIAELEDISSVPAFKIYKDGSKIKEISGDDCDLLESSVKLISSKPSR